jgi:hypothetical protein
VTGFHALNRRDIAEFRLSAEPQNNFLPEIDLTVDSQ